MKPFFRNLQLEKFSLYDGKKLLFTFKCSWHWLPGSLDSLAKTLCPEWGPKGSIPHEELEVEDIYRKSKELKDYTKQDIRLLGGLMSTVKRFSISFFYSFSLEYLDSVIASSYNLSNYSLALVLSIYQVKTKIFRYYGGHTDSYITHGENLYYYDVNSLYPSIMKISDMPGAGDQVLSNFFGFLEAYVSCPSSTFPPL